MNWAEINQMFLSTVGAVPSAASNSLLYLTEGARQVANKLNLQNLERAFEPIALTENQDWVPLPSGILHVLHIEETTTGQEIVPSDGGTRGRARNLAPGGAAPPGVPREYSISGDKIYFDAAPNASTYQIRITAKVQMPQLVEADMGSYPALPEQYHLCVPLAAALAFWATHPEAAKQLPEGHRQSVYASLNSRLEQPLPREKESFDRRGRVMLPGFNMRFR